MKSFLKFILLFLFIFLNVTTSFSTTKEENILFKQLVLEKKLFISLNKAIKNKDLPKILENIQQLEELNSFFNPETEKLIDKGYTLAGSLIWRRKYRYILEKLPPMVIATLSLKAKKYIELFNYIYLTDNQELVEFILNSVPAPKNYLFKALDYYFDQNYKLAEKYMKKFLSYVKNWNKLHLQTLKLAAIIFYKSENIKLLKKIVSVLSEKYPTKTFQEQLLLALLIYEKEILQKNVPLEKTILPKLLKKLSIIDNHNILLNQLKSDIYSLNEKYTDAFYSLILNLNSLNSDILKNLLINAYHANKPIFIYKFYKLVPTFNIKNLEVDEAYIYSLIALEKYDELSKFLKSKNNDNLYSKTCFLAFYNARTDLLKSFSKEFKTPFNNIALSLYFILENKLDKAIEALKNIERKESYFIQYLIYLKKNDKTKAAIYENLLKEK